MIWMSCFGTHSGVERLDACIEVVRVRTERDVDERVPSALRRSRPRAPRALAVA